MRVPLRVSLILPASDSTSSAEYVRARCLRIVVRLFERARYARWWGFKRDMTISVPCSLWFALARVRLGTLKFRDARSSSRSYADADILGVARA